MIRSTISRMTIDTDCGLGFIIRSKTIIQSLDTEIMLPKGHSGLEILLSIHEPRVRHSPLG